MESLHVIQPTETPGRGQWSDRPVGRVGSGTVRVVSEPDDSPVSGPIPGGPDPQTTRRWRRRLADERAEARTYRAMAERWEGADREILLGLADAEERHIAHWEDLLGPESVDDVGRGSLRLRMIAATPRWFGSVFILALAQRAEMRSASTIDPDATPAMVADEKVHEEVLRGLAARGRAQVSGTFRAVVFGMNDGLVSNLALILGVSGGGVEPGIVLLTGIAGLLAGASSMAAGEYLSIRSQRELIEASAPSEGSPEVLSDLDVDANELALVYRARGMTETEAEEYADAVLAGRRRPAHEERSVEPDDTDVVGTAAGAALASFLSFGVGALIPVLPFIFGLGGWPGITVGVVLAGLALVGTGAISGVLSGGPPLMRGMRQLLIGLAAAGVTYLLGLAVGAGIG